MKPRPESTSNGPGTTPRQAQLFGWILTGSRDAPLGRDATSGSLSAAHDIQQLARVGYIAAKDWFGVSAGERPGRSVRAVSQGEWIEHTALAVAALLEEALIPLDPNELLGADSLPRTEQPIVDLICRTPGGYEELFANLSGLLLAHVASRAVGARDILLPSVQPDLLINVDNAGSFATTWGLPSQAVLAWACQHQAILDAIYSQPAVRKRVRQLEVSYLTPRDASGDQARIGTFFGSDRRGTVVDIDSLLESIQGDRSRDAAEELDAIAALANACSWFAVRNSGPELVTRYLDPLLEVTIRRQSEPGIWDRVAETWFGAPLGSIARPDALALIETLADLGGRDRLHWLWAADHGVPTARTLVDPAGWLADAGADASFAARVSDDWKRRLDAYPGQDVRGGRPRLPGQRPPLARSQSRTWPHEPLDIPGLRQYAQGMIDRLAPGEDVRIAEKMRGEIDGLHRPEHVTLLRPDGTVSPDYYLGVLTGHLHAYLVRRRGPMCRRRSNTDPLTPVEC